MQGAGQPRCADATQAMLANKTRCAQEEIPQLGAGMGAGHHCSATGQHAGELARHHQISGLGLLRQQVNVGGGQQVWQALKRLQV